MNYSRYLCYYFKYEILLSNEEDGVNYGYHFRVIFGLIAGILAKWIMPGKDGGGFIVTIVLGIIGAVVGGWISTFLAAARSMALISAALSWRSLVH
jgi:uncharacterized membrane protein YeaQ/YmgE (transglycosylase-associated protein family)